MRIVEKELLNGLQFIRKDSLLQNGKGPFLGKFCKFISDSPLIFYIIVTCVRSPSENGTIICRLAYK